MAKKINSNTKGKVAEREVAELLRAHDFNARRGQQFSGGGDSPDVVSDLGLHIEVKRVEAFNLYSAVEQAKKDCKSKEYAIFHRKNNKDWVTILDSDVFLFVMRQNKELTKEYLRLKDIEEKFNALTR
jgi:hypothetical protein